MTRTPLIAPCGTLTLRNVRPGSGRSSRAAARRRRHLRGRTEVPLPRRSWHPVDTPMRLVAEQRAFERAGHRARVRHVVADVQPLVDAGDDDVGALRQQLRRSRCSRSRSACRQPSRRSAAPSSRRSGRRSVSACPTALASVCGATMMTSPSGASAVCERRNSRREKTVVVRHENRGHEIARLYHGDDQTRRNQRRRYRTSSTP